jgi:hypothetical protein
MLAGSLFAAEHWIALHQDSLYALLRHVRESPIDLGRSVRA